MHDVLELLSNMFLGGVYWILVALSKYVLISAAVPASVIEVALTRVSTTPAPTVEPSAGETKVPALAVRVTVRLVPISASAKVLAGTV